ncbi:MAG: type I 3-dehydroquinate dehydratase [Bacteroidales bacterium]|nr:type I 3-dehydroquinate dehydratase [Bacteroidales bacterium]
MICVAIADKNPEVCLRILEQVELAEIRIDLTGFDEEQVRKVCSHSTPTVATCRADNLDAEIQYQLLVAAIESGAAYVDVEIEAGRQQIDRIGAAAKKAGCKLIVSYHNYSETPSSEDLNMIIEECFSLGADIAKLATRVNHRSDNARLLSLYASDKPLVILGMGETGKITRIMAPFLGAEFSFAGMDDGKITAPGQIPYSQMKSIIENLQRELQQAE